MTGCTEDLVRGGGAVSAEHRPQDPSGDLTTYGELAEILSCLPMLAREHRRSLRLSLRAAGEQANVSYATLHRLESAAGETSLPNAIAVLRWMDRGAAGQETPDA